MNSSNKLRKGIAALIAAVLFLGLFSILAETATDKTCTANGKSGTCLLTVECTNNGGTSYPHSATVTGCKDYKKDIQCCIPKEDDGSVTIDASPATVAFKSEPITLVSDRVFLETYSKTSKIIDASKITYKGEPIFENAACVLNNDNPNIGGRVEVTVKVFNNIDEQIDTMTFVMKAGGDLWDYAECGDGTTIKGECRSDKDVPVNYVLQPDDKGELKKQCNDAYNAEGFLSIAKSESVNCYAEKATAGATTEIKKETTGTTQEKTSSSDGIKLGKTCTYATGKQGACFDKDSKWKAYATGTNVPKQAVSDCGNELLCYPDTAFIDAKISCSNSGRTGICMEDSKCDTTKKIPSPADHGLCPGSNAIKCCEVTP